MRNCSFQKIACPKMSCKKMVLIAEVVDHLKMIHNSKVFVSNSGILRTSVLMSDRNFPTGSGAPYLIEFDGDTFIIHIEKRNFSLSWWVSVLGPREVSAQYEVKISTSCEETCVASFSNKGRVYSSYINSEEVLSNPEGILELSKNQVRKVEKKVGDKYQVYLDFEIYRKSKLPTK